MLRLFTLPIIVTIIFWFVIDFNKKRNRILNTLLIINFITFLLFPWAYLIVLNLYDGQTWNEINLEGVFWYYVIVFPFCTLLAAVLGVLKLYFRIKSKKEDFYG